MAPGVPPRTPKLHKTFQEVKIHTAKCDECNKHNKNTIYRCVDCNSQCCTPCWDKKGGDGKHVVDSVLMTNNRPVIVSVADAPRNKVVKKTVKSRKSAVVVKDEDDDAEEGPSEVAATTEKQKSPQGSKKQAKNGKNVTVQDSDAEDDDILDQPIPVPKKTVKMSKKQMSSKRDTVMYDNDSDSADSTPPPIPHARATVDPNGHHATSSNPITTGMKTASQGKNQDLKRKRPVIGADSKSNSESSKLPQIDKDAAEASRKKRRVTISKKASIVSHQPVQAGIEEDVQDTDILANYLLDFSRGALAAEPSSPLPASHEENRHAGQLLDIPTQADKGRSLSPELQLSSPVHRRELKTATPGTLIHPSSPSNNTGLPVQAKHRAKPTAAESLSDNETHTSHPANKKSQTSLPIPKSHNAISHPSSSNPSTTHTISPASPTHQIQQSHAKSYGVKAPHPQLSTRISSRPTTTTTTTSRIRLATSANGTAQTGEVDLATSNTFRFLTPLTTAKDVANDTEEQFHDDGGEEEQGDESEDVDGTGERSRAGDDLSLGGFGGRFETDDDEAL